MTTPNPVRIAMWSGPRNISTAMMRSFGNRPDTVVCDEPLYAHYLTRVEVDHPGADEVIARHETDWRKVTAWLVGPIPDGKSVFYQKHMTHHLLDHIERDWVAELDNAFLIREPEEMLTSLAKVMPAPGLADTGLAQQVELFEWLARRTGRIPPVVDAADVLGDPKRVLAALCEALGVPFTQAMLEWPPGRRPTDGVWAKHWYGSVERSTGFRPYRPKGEPVPAALRGLLDDCRGLYQTLHRHRLGAGDQPAG